MCPTVLGRLQTRVVTLIGPAILGVILWLATGNEGFPVLIGVYLLLGTVLDTGFYPFIIRWQPPWLTFVLAIGEFVILFVLAKVLKVGLTDFQAVWFFWVSWVIANWTKVAILPIVSLSWIENAGEFRRTGWTLPAETTPFPILAAVERCPDGTPALLREFTAVGEIPEELRSVPPPSGVGQKPDLR